MPDALDGSNAAGQEGQGIPYTRLGMDYARMEIRGLTAARPEREGIMEVQDVMDALIHARCHWMLKDFAAATYGDTEEETERESRHAYLASKFKLFQDSPVLAYCDLDLMNRRRFCKALTELVPT